MKNRAQYGVGPLETELIDSFASGDISRRSFMVRGSIMGLGVAFMGSIAAACGSDDSGSTTGKPADKKLKAGGTLRVASQKPGGPLDPVAMAELGTYTMCSTAFEYLCGKGDGATLAPALAESWKPNADGSKWTFSLRKGATWHDGSPFTAADVVATLDRLSEANLKAYIVAGAAVADDDSTVTVTLNAPDGQFPYQVSLYNPQSLITPASFALGSVLDGSEKGGTGAFKLDKFDAATGATFVKNDKWWGGVPLLDKVEFIFSDDIATQMSGLQGGAADAIVQFSVSVATPCWPTRT